MKYYVITDFNYFYTEQWLTPKDIEHQRKSHPDYKIMTKEEFDDTARMCTHCGRVMKAGFCINQGEQYFCSDSCLYENYTKEEFDEMYNDGEGDTFYTEWSY